MPPEPTPDKPSSDTSDVKASNLKNSRPAAGMWPAILPSLLASIRSHTTTLVFCNSRRLAERIAQELNDLAGEEICKAHHGSVARELRKKTEEALKRGELRSLVATSSMELGIDISSIDLVVQIGSPASVSQGLQRVGRAGHALGIRSQGLIIPKFRGDLLEATAVGHGMRNGSIEECVVPQNCLDILAQQIVAMCSTEERNADTLLGIIRRAYSYRTLSVEAYHSVLDMLSGRFSHSEMPQFRPRINWDRQENRLQARQGSKMLSLINGGTIPDRGLFAVHLGQGGPRIGELDEEMVYEARAGECFLLGASTWRILEINRDQVIVAPAPGESGKMPFWRGEGPGRPASLGRDLGAIARKLAACDDKECTQLLENEYQLSPDASEHLLTYLRNQEAATGTIPSDTTIVIERFPDEVGDWRVCILSPFGTRVHAPWAMAIAALLSETGFDSPQMHWTDDGIALHLPNTGRAPDTDSLLPSSEQLRELLVNSLAGSALFATHFRENAARALLLPRQRPGKRTPLWLQRLKSQQLLDATREFPNFPIVIETYRECMQDVFDLASLENILDSIRDGAIKVESIETPSPSPFARGLVYSYTAAFLYEGDAPSAERKAAALNLDRSLLSELLGSENLRDFLDLDVIGSVEEELQYLAKDRQIRNADQLHDLLRTLGALSENEIDKRCEEPARAWLETLVASARACEIHLGGDSLWIALEHAAAYRDALNVTLPEGIPRELLVPAPDAIF
ncbi:MAG: DEAD/DEAH box helicase, partial [Kofleriaceae bacterium]|nr:DEAD/DEAH box helicase [Kofleriaceae bacterium]